jgi:hypothetical protein
MANHLTAILAFENAASRRNAARPFTQALAGLRFR